MRAMSTLGLPFRPDLAEDPDVSERRLVRSLLGSYCAFGAYWGVWVILVFDVQSRHDLGETSLGFLYTLLSGTAVLTMLVIAPRLQPLPLATSVPLSILSLAVGAVAIALLPSAWLWLGFMAVGVGNGMIDVFLNVAAQRAEVRTGRPVLQWLHASYALGGVLGAAVAGTVRFAGLDYRVGLLLSGLALFLGAWWTTRTIPAEPPPPGSGTVFSVSALFRSPVLWVAALAVLAAFLVEGSMDTWSGLYLRDELGASAGAAALAFIAFSGAAFAGRLFAGKVLFGLGHRRTLIAAGLGSFAAACLVVISSDLWIVGLGFLLMGFAISAAAPAGIGLVDVATGVDPTDAIAGVTTVGYTGFIWSPPLLGWIAEAFDLRVAMGVIVVATLGIVAAGLAAPADRGAGRPVGTG
jgi:hypothetical protein